MAKFVESDQHQTKQAKRNEDVYLYEKYGFKQSYSQMKLYETF